MSTSVYECKSLEQLIGYHYSPHDTYLLLLNKNIYMSTSVYECKSLEQLINYAKSRRLIKTILN